MTVEKFTDFKSSLIDQLLQPDTSLSDEASKHWPEILARRCGACTAVMR
jgi:hypothetical protein